MSKMVVVSDSHGLVNELEQIYDHFKDETTLFFHCGDSELNKDHSIFNHYKAVKGNCDGYGFDDVYVEIIGNKKILFTHGHLFHVKFNLNRLYYYALENNVDCVCFGHTHMPVVIREDDVVLMNPGSIHRTRGLKENTFAIIELKEEIKITYYDVQTLKEIKLKNT